MNFKYAARSAPSADMVGFSSNEVVANYWMSAFKSALQKANGL